MAIGLIGRRLKRAGVTQARLARAAGVSERMVSYVLAGQRASRRVVAVARRLIKRAGK